MPELPEVETVAVALRRALVGRRLRALRVRWPGVLADGPTRVRRAVTGRTLTRVGRHGKYLLLSFEDPDGAAAPAHLMVHLRMTGQFLLEPRQRPDRHVHLVLDFEGRRVHYRDVRKFGRFRLVDDAERPSALSHVGPDMLRIGYREWRERVGGRRAPIKSVLLDQGVAAGLGNIYADEALHRAAVHPLARPVDLPDGDLRRIHREARGILRLALRHGGTTFLDFADAYGRPGRFLRLLRVYRRTGEPCRRCGHPIARLVVGGRATHYCPACQSGADAGGAAARSACG